MTDEPRAPERICIRIPLSVSCTQWPVCSNWCAVQTSHHGVMGKGRAQTMAHGSWLMAAVAQLSWSAGSTLKQRNAVRKVLYLLIGLLLAIVLGSLYVRFSMPPGEVSAAAAPLQTTADGPAFGLMLAVAIACWVSTFLPLPRWLSVLLGGCHCLGRPGRDGRHRLFCVHAIPQQHPGRWRLRRLFVRHRHGHLSVSQCVEVHAPRGWLMIAASAQTPRVQLAPRPKRRRCAQPSWPAPRRRQGLMATFSTPSRWFANSS